MSGPAALSELSRHLDLLDEALDAGDWDAVTDLEWAPPPSSTQLGDDDRDAAEALLRRVASCQERVRAALEGARGELDGLSLRRRAAARYAGAGEELTGP